MKIKLLAALCILALGISHGSEISPWRFEAGLSVGNVIPANVILGVGYSSVIFRFQGMGAHYDANDYWCGIRGGIDWSFFRNKPFSIDYGISGGYAFAEAPNEMHKTFNKANGGKYLYPYNYKELLDVSAEIWIHLYGFFTQIALPVYRFKEHDDPKFLWRAGYMIKF
ncbi:MAG: hypothetical protein HUK21_08310 [Fibrobacteraceae bacterium]|nr:hypothetical protein [Fibrobacteraceae bacterium]MCF0215585.1 hypothetical protein [Fibrobacteraceae bacterium]MCF0216460.1 hypothetical protein [Fibrobacteraceae bacterium]